MSLHLRQKKRAGQGGIMIWHADWQRLLTFRQLNRRAQVNSLINASWQQAACPPGKDQSGVRHATVQHTVRQCDIVCQCVFVCVWTVRTSCNMRLN